MENTSDASTKFGQTFAAWYKYKLPAKQWLKDGYAGRDDDENWFLTADFEALYRDYFPGGHYDGVLEKAEPDFQDIGRLIQLSYNCMVRPEHREDFAAAVNVALDKFDAPLIFSNGDFTPRTASQGVIRAVAGNSLAHKIAAVVFLVLMLLSMLRGCGV